MTDQEKRDLVEYLKMSICTDVDAFDSAYESIIKAIGYNDLSAIQASYSHWLQAREKLAAHLSEATRVGKLNLVIAIDSFVRTSFESLNSDTQTLLSLYPKYLEARGAVRGLACDDLISRIAKAGELKVEVAIPGIKAGIDIKKLLGLGG